MNAATTINRQLQYRNTAARDYGQTRNLRPAQTRGFEEGAVSSAQDVFDGFFKMFFGFWNCATAQNNSAPNQKGREHVFV